MNQGCWQWLTVAHLLASRSLPPDLRSFLVPMDPAMRLGEVARKLEALQQETPGQRLVEVAALGLLLATPLAITGVAQAALLRGALLLVGLIQLPGILREQQQNWHCRRAAPDLAKRLQEAADNVGSPWIESLPDGGRLDRRYQVSSRLPRREVCADRWGQPVRHEWELQVARGTLRFVGGPKEVEVTGPGGEECRFGHSGIQHAESWVMISLHGTNLRIDLNGSLSLVWWEIPDPVCPRNCPGSDDEVWLPEGVWRSGCGGPCTTRIPDRVDENSFVYGDDRIDCPLPLAWLA